MGGGAAVVVVGTVTGITLLLSEGRREPDLGDDEVGNMNDFDGADFDNSCSVALPLMSRPPVLGELDNACVDCE